ncbi:hypothetical protein J7M02_07785 [Candidatus Aerophobetes bacterium]|nr:hypothetical protein [Candidatus Aerophobetes bacterium]
MVVDYSQHFTHLKEAIAQGEGKNFLLLFKYGSVKRLDGKIGEWVVEYRWLSTECRHEDDEAYVCVEGSDETIWTEEELRKLGLEDLKRGKITLFDMFYLF